MKVLSRHLYQDPRMLATEWNVIYCDLAKAIREYGQKTFQPQIGASVTEKVAGRNVFYAHGGFSLEDPLICMEQNLITGHAVRDYAARLKCFADMRKNDCWLFFRGHDHVRQVWSMDEHSKTISWHVGSKIRLDPCLRYIVTFGSFSADMRSNRHEYAVFDEENRTLCFGTKNILEI
jgi:hypothetical protein